MNCYIKIRLLMTVEWRIIKYLILKQLRILYSIILEVTKKSISFFLQHELY